MVAIQDAVVWTELDWTHITLCVDGWPAFVYTTIPSDSKKNGEQFLVCLTG
jgi:hypothetical protein